MLKITLTLLFACWFFLRANDCTPAVVTYEATSTLTSVPDGKLTTTNEAIGCVAVQGDSILVIRTLSSGKAIDAIAIPAGAVTSITKLEAAHDNQLHPQVLPNVQTQDEPQRAGTQSAQARLMRFLRSGGI